MSNDRRTPDPADDHPGPGASDDIDAALRKARAFDVIQGERANRGREDAALLARLLSVASGIEVPRPYEVLVALDEDAAGGAFLQVGVTGAQDVPVGSRAYPSPHATEVEIVQTVWELTQRAVLADLRERFTWRGHAVFDPAHALRVVPEARTGT